MDSQSDYIIRNSRKHQQEEKQAAGFVIEKQADKKQVGISKATLFVDDRVNCQVYQQESPEIEPGEQQGGILLIKEYV